MKLNRIEVRTIGTGAFTIRPVTTQINVDLAPFAPDRLPTLDPARLRGAGR